MRRKVTSDIFPPFFVRHERKKYHLTLGAKEIILTGTLLGNGSDSIEKTLPARVSNQVFLLGYDIPSKDFGLKIQFIIPAITSSGRSFFSCHMKS